VIPRKAALATWIPFSKRRSRITFGRLVQIDSASSVIEGEVSITKTTSMEGHVPHSSGLPSPFVSWLVPLAMSMASSMPLPLQSGMGVSVGVKDAGSV